MLRYNHLLFQCFLQECLAHNHYLKKFFCNKMVRTEQDKQFSVMQMSGNNSSSSLDLIILILLLGRFVLMKEIPGEHFLSHNSGKTLYTASYSESWREIINEYAIFFIASCTFNFFFFFPLQPFFIAIFIWSFKFFCCNTNCAKNM